VASATTGPNPSVVAGQPDPPRVELAKPPNRGDSDYLALHPPVVRRNIMASPEDEPVRTRQADRSPVNWLLIIPIVVPLLVPLYNGSDPKLLGFPRFYWLQLAFIILGVAATTVVYQTTKRRR
jgi:Protein of unknown function (DUF3311)